MPAKCLIGREQVVLQALYGRFCISLYPLSTPQSHPTILISMGYLFYSPQIGSLALLAEVWREAGRARWW